MSAFLGPVHHWMYQKILLQEQLTNRLLALAEQSGWESGFAARLEVAYGKQETAPLEEIIDTSNIHGWLSSRVARAENRFAQAVNTLLEPDKTRLEEMAALFETAGNEHAVVSCADVESAYQVMDGLLLDGMPCDGGRKITAQDADSLIWEYDPALHPLCRIAEGKAAFSSLRTAFLSGALAGSGFLLEPLGQTVYRIGKAA